MRYYPLQGKGALAYRHSTAAGNVWEGAVRSSKTVGSIMRWIEFVRHGPPGELLMVGKTERTLKRNVIDVMAEMLGSKRVKTSTGAGEVKILGRRIYIAGANDERAAEKIQGMTLAGFYGDELSTWPKSVFDIATTRLSIDGAQWFGTSNPAAPTHWLKTDWIDRAKLHVTREGEVLRRLGDEALDVHVFSFTLRDNPWLSPGFIARLEKQYVGVFHRRFILGEWCLAEGAIYDMFDERVHVLDPARIPHIHRWVSAGIDYGTRNPTHAVLFGLGSDIDESRPGAALYAVSEWRFDSRKARRQMSDTQYSEAIRGWLAGVEIVRQAPGRPALRGVRPEYTCVDPSAASLRVQLYHDGLMTVAANNDVLDGIRTCSSLFASRKLYISGDCPELIAEIPAYSWDDKAAKIGEDKPVKSGDHGCDGMRYGIKTPESVWHHDVYAGLRAAA